MKRTSATKRTLEWLRDQGFTVAITERWNPFAKIRQDLFGFIDLIAIRSSEIIGVQCTAASERRRHREKILGLETARLWVQGGGAIWLVCWRRRERKGKRVEFLHDLEVITFEGTDGNKGRTVGEDGV